MTVVHDAPTPESDLGAHGAVEGHLRAGDALCSTGHVAEAEAHFRQAYRLDPGSPSARRKLALLLVRLGRRDESLPLWHADLQAGGLRWFEKLIATSVSGPDLALAAEYAAVFAALRWGSKWYPETRGTTNTLAPSAPPDASLSIPKLRHDIEQFQYLQSRGIIGKEFSSVIDEYRATIERLSAIGEHARMPLDEEALRKIGDVYNRIVHIRQTPRVRRALGRWDAAAVESRYLGHRPGLAVVDDFLSEEALKELHLFCLESTVWSSTRHAHGRLGAQYQNGFNCPLLVQIAEELRQAFPRLIGDRYPFRHMWGYKSPPTLPADSSIHADFAAVNVNVWITPDEANLDESSGGLIVYGVDAPLHWDFEAYNARMEDVIKPYIRRQRAPAATIPYRQNRAVIFNSDLFHCTAAVNFRPEYQNRRINVTMLYGNREDDADHQGLGVPDPAFSHVRQVAAWRSAAFSHLRRRHG